MVDVFLCSKVNAKNTNIHHFPSPSGYKYGPEYNIGIAIDSAVT